MAKAEIYADRSFTYLLWVVYTLDSTFNWKRGRVCSTKKEAVDYCKKNNLEIESITE